jgi:hypothetical protein
MSSRVLKRPMFRRGGMANQGIMSGLVDRTGYQDGDLVKQRQEIERELYPPTLLGDTSRLLGNVNDFLFNYGARPLGNLANYITGMGEGINTIKPIDSLEKNIDMVLEMRGQGTDDDAVNPDAVPDAVSGEGAEENKGDKGEGGKSASGDLSESDLKTVYADLLPMFKETLGVDDEDYKKDAYLQLARFGTNLMAQPGGSLTAAIGRAAEKPLEGIGDIVASKRAAERRPKELALQAALRETEPGSIGKSVRDLMKLGYSKDQAIKEIVEGRGGEATKQATKARIMKEDEDAILAGNLVTDQFQARKIAKQMDKYGISFDEIVGKLPDDTSELIEGGIYIDKGVIKKHKKGKFYKVTEKGFN